MCMDDIAMGIRERKSYFSLISHGQKYISVSRYKWGKHLKIYFNFFSLYFSFLICNVVLVLGVQQSDSVTYTHTHTCYFFKFFSI